MNSATAARPPVAADFPPRRLFPVAALPALFGLTVRQTIRGRRLLVLALLFALPAVMAGALRFAGTGNLPPATLEFDLVFNFFPHALAPLAALLFAAGIIQDEVEEQTLTYLLLRPIPRWALYVVKVVAVWLVAALLTGVFTILVEAIVWWGSPRLWEDVLPWRAAKVAGLLALAEVGYCALFGALGLYTRRSLIFGLGYIVAFEGIMANIQFVARQFTVMFYFRVLAVRWLEPAGSKDWKLDLALVPSAQQCVQTLLTASAVLVLLGALMTAQREFRMKTPEGN